jgi:hypothetical protein
MINHFRDTLDQASGIQNRRRGIARESSFFCGFPRTVSLAESTEVWRKRAPENVFGLPSKHGGAEIDAANSRQ